MTSSGGRRRHLSVVITTSCRGDVAGQLLLLRLPLVLGQRAGVAALAGAGRPTVSSMNVAPTNSASVLVSGRTS